MFNMFDIHLPLDITGLLTFKLSLGTLEDILDYSLATASYNYQMFFFLYCTGSNTISIDNKNTEVKLLDNLQVGGYRGRNLWPYSQYIWKWMMVMKFIW